MSKPFALTLDKTSAALSSSPLSRYNMPMKNPHFYAVIIGTEILNGRRQDKHFNFVREALAARGYVLFASLVIKDDPLLIEHIFTMIKADPDAVLFSFGGIGSTPDDLTREIASKVFTSQKSIRHKQFENDIIERFKEEAYPHRIQMADLPNGSQLLKNPVNNMSGFFLDNRYFFVPGFPEMAHAMIQEALERFYPKNRKTYRKTLLADTSENTLIDIMKEMPPQMELSSLPMLRNGTASVELSIASDDQEEVDRWFDLFVTTIKSKGIQFNLVP